MKKRNRHIFCAWVLVICFAAGQWAVYAHQHKTFALFARATHGTVITEKCQLCDAMHHNSMEQQAPAAFVAPVNVNDYVYKQGTYDFVSISLVLSAGRAPPLS